ncbi:MAG: type II toxin-antitoxin system VapC family toxin [gamma proteobacterium endosymbiont of Lamellibrachia anaximandri]|nr:type II toxin-antitoxin system VapC family toxin [gamma proteobacterium endosymbiont of Lamellibrachia anaximandri]
MIGVDTNVVVRLLTRDDESQYQTALSLFDGNQIFIPNTVILELEWVLRFAYRFKPAQIADALEKLAGLEQVTVDRPDDLSLALQGLRNNMDFADALHLAITAAATRQFATFDQKLTRYAQHTSCQVKLLD